MKVKLTHRRRLLMSFMDSFIKSYCIWVFGVPVIAVPGSYAQPYFGEAVGYTVDGLPISLLSETPFGGSSEYIPLELLSPFIFLGVF